MWKVGFSVGGPSLSDYYRGPDDTEIEQYCASEATLVHVSKQFKHATHVGSTVCADTLPDHVTTVLGALHQLMNYNSLNIDTSKCTQISF